VNTPQEHPEVQKERASVPATEGSPELGGWKEGYVPATDPSSAIAQAYLSLPYGNDSWHFREPGYFRNVQQFVPEFDFVLRHLPRTGLLLDLGADGTWSTAQLARRGLTCIALDITDHLSLARLFQTACPPYALVNVDMHEPAFADESFDVITAFNAMHHSKRLDTLAANVARMLKRGGTLAFVEPYVQNAQQAADFGAAQSAAGINENVHTVGRWHEAFSAAGLTLDRFAITSSLNAIYRKTDAAPLTRDPFDSFYDALLHISPPTAVVQRGIAQQFQVTIENRGRAAWATRGPTPVRLSYHVSQLTAQGLVTTAFDNDRTPLPSFIHAGEHARVPVSVTIDEVGLHVVEFDLVHETVSWFKDRGGRTATARLTVR